MLGRLEVVDGDRDLTPRPPKQRALLALLLLRAGEVVETDEASDALWEGRPPPAARNAVQGHVAALRRLLGRDRIETRGRGYVLRLDEDELDLHHFERLLTDARGRPPSEQSELLEQALGLFHGAPLEDFRYDSFATAEAARADELRMLAFETRFDADLTLGRHQQIVPELEQLATEAPLRERLQYQLMLALYRSGRQADALAAYQRARTALVDELGLEPGQALQHLERQILNQDAELEVADLHPPRARIPSPPTPLLGRTQELADARDLLLRSDVRLVTLTGPGGIGKTRLAIELARSTVPHFPGGVFFVPLASIADAGVLLPTLARGMGVSEEGSMPLVELVAVALAEQPTLVVIDNFEHLLEGAPTLGELLAATPALKLLVTSREILRLYGEHLYRVPPLEADAAATLFLDRAQAVQADIDRSTATSATVAAICRRLDCLPLAIELAAAHAELFSPEALLARLGERLELLAEGSRDLPERQRTLRATIAWSYERLISEEQQLLARLAVFAGSWTLDAADAVCSGDDVIRGLSSLVDKSLLRYVDDRFWMLETIREYAADQLEGSGDAEVVRGRHADHFLALAEEAEPHLREIVLRGRRGDWLDRLEREHDNLRAALDWFETRGETQSALRMAGALADFWYETGHFAEGRQRLEGLLRSDERPTAARGSVLIGAADLAAVAGDRETEALRAEEALALHRTLGDTRGTADSLWMLGGVAVAAGDHTRARQLLGESVALFDELGDDAVLGATRTLAWSYLQADEVESARVLYEDVLNRARERGNVLWEAVTLGALAIIAAGEGRVEEARSLLTENMPLYQSLDSPFQMAENLCRVAEVLASTGETVTAAMLLACSDAECERVGAGIPWVLTQNEKTLASVRAQLADTVLADAWERGRAMTIEQGVELALASLE